MHIINIYIKKIVYITIPFQQCCAEGINNPKTILLPLYQ